MNRMSSVPGLRHHPVEAVFNLRDLGGYPTRDGGTTRWRRLFRSDGLHRTDALGGEAVAALGIRRVIDLRTDDERVNDGFFTHRSIEHVHIPIIETMWTMTELAAADEVDFLLTGYRLMAAGNGARLGQALLFIADHGHEPLVFHCAAGKDRTGVLAALLLALVGVSDEIIAEDFALSGPAAQQMAAWYRANRTDVAERTARMGLDRDQAMRLLSAEPATILTFLAELRAQHGSIEAYVGRHGVDRAAIDRLRGFAVE
jgi:protein tyrosine/serine phosphatase